MRRKACIYHLCINRLHMWPIHCICLGKTQVSDVALGCYFHSAAEEDVGAILAIYVNRSPEAHPPPSPFSSPS